jgi:hypothetical protein
MEIHVPAEAHSRLPAADDPTVPDDGECALCFTFAMYRRFGCDGSLRWVRRWRDTLRPEAAGLERRLGSRRGHCDCEILLDGWDLLPELMGRDPAGDIDWPPVMPPCAGVDPRSCQPCALWDPRRRP